MEIRDHYFAMGRSVAVRRVTREIILHCSATQEGKDYTVDDIDRWHRDRGFSCIGYHYVIYRDGSVHRGRWENLVGAHCTGHNDVSIGVCYIGGVAKDGNTAKDTRTEAQKKSMMELVMWLLVRYGLRADAVHGHNEFAKKACPSFNVDAFLSKLMNGAPALVPSNKSDGV